MDEKIKIMISLGAAVAANCIPCFEHLYRHSKTVNLSDETIHDIVDIASKVKSGAHVALKGSVDDIMGIGRPSGDVSSGQAENCECGCLS